MQALQAWRKKRNTTKSALSRLSYEPKRRLSHLVATTTLWLVARHIGGHLGKGLRALANAYAPPAATPKALSFKLRSIRRLWGSTLTIGIRLKW